MSDTLDRRDLNRAFLARQLLLVRAEVSAGQAVTALVGMQAQQPLAPYVGLWSRVAGFDPAAAGQALLDRRLVRTVLMRSTIHLVTAADARGLRSLLQPMLEQRFNGSMHPKELAGVDPREIAAAAEPLLAAEPITFADLGAALARRWPQGTRSALSQAARTYLSLVQTPPRGVWGRGGAARHVTATAWLGPAGPALSVDELVLRYLVACGPATVADMQSWSGLTRLREIVERLDRRLRHFRGPDGTDLVDLPEAPRPAGDTPAPVRLLAEYDNALLSHADRTRIVADAHRARLMQVNGIIPGTVLVDGFVAGQWRPRRGTGVIEVRAFHRLPKRAATAVVAEVRRLARFLAPDLEPEVVVTTD